MERSIYVEEELLKLIDKVSVYNKKPLVVIYDYLPQEEKDVIRIENDIEVWRGVEVIRLGDIEH